MTKNFLRAGGEAENRPVPSAPPGRNRMIFRKNFRPGLEKAPLR